MYWLRKNKHIKVIIWPLVVIFILTFSSTPSIAFVKSDSSSQKQQVKQDKHSDQLKFARGRFIVRLSDSDLSSGSNIVGLNKKHKVKSFKKLQKLDKAQLKSMKIDRLSKKGKLNAKSFANGQDPADQIPDLSSVYLVEVDDAANIETIVQEYQDDPAVAFAQPDYEMEPKFTMNDPYMSDLWGMNMINASQAWDIAQGDGVVVGIVDTGIDYAHEDLAANMWINPGEIANNGVDDDGNGFIDDIYGWDFNEDDNDPWDGHYHGTHVSGTVAAVGNNGIGVAGVAPRAKLMAIKGLSDTGSGYSSDLAQGIEYAALNGADVINNSWGCSSACPSNPVVEDAVRTAHALGSVIVFAAGNSNVDTASRSPNNMQEVVSVASSTSSDLKSYFSNWGSMIDVIAPGSTIYSTMPGNAYDYLSGTSMASPHVAGLAALIISNHPEFTNEEVRSVMRSSADDFGDTGFDIYGGHGRINAYQALLMNSPLQAEITNPAPPDSFIDLDNEFLIIEGVAAGVTFQEYTLEYKPYDNSSDWVLASGPFNSAVTQDVLGDLPLSSLAENAYLLKISATASDGNIFEDVVQFQGFRNNPLISKIASNANVNQRVKVFGNYVAWVEHNQTTLRYDLKYYDMQDQTTVIIVEDVANISDFDILDDKIVYKEYGVPYVYSYDIATSQFQQLFYRVDVRQLNVMADKIVWYEYNSSTAGSDIYYYDMNDGSINKVPISTTAYFNSLKAGNNKIVWKVSPNVYMYDLDTSTETIITDQDPFIFDSDGQKVVWADYDATYDYIKVYDIATSQETTIATTVNYIFDPAVSENNVAYVLWDGATYHTYKYDLNTDIQEQLTVMPVYRRSYPDIWNSKIAWMEEEVTYSSFRDVYLYNPDVVNLPPTLASIGNQTVNEGNTLSITVSAVDPNTQQLIFAHPLVAELPLGASFNIVTDELGSLQGQFEWMPNYAQAGSYDVVFEVFDGEFYSSEVVTIDVIDTQEQPLIILPANGALIDQETVDFQWTPGDSVTKYWLDVGSTLGGSDIYSGSYNKSTTSVTVTGIPLDGNTLFVTHRFKQGKNTIERYYEYERIDTTNYLPVLSFVADQAVYVGDNVQFTFTATDPNNGPLTFTNPTAQELPVGSFFDIQGTDAPIYGTFNWTPTSGQVGDHAIMFIVSDGELTASQTVNISVTEPPMPTMWIDLVGLNTNGNELIKTAGDGWTNGGAASAQIITGDGVVDVLAYKDGKHWMIGLSTDNLDASYSSIDYAMYINGNGVLGVYENGSYRGSIGNYADGDRVQVERAGTAVLYKLNGVVLYTSTISSFGDLLIDVSIYSMGGRIVDANVLGGGVPNNAPVAENKNVTVDKNTAKAITLVATDADGDSLTYSVVISPINGTLSGTAPDLTYMPDADFTGSDNFTFIANDGTEDSTIATVSIDVVSALNNAPVADNQNILVDMDIAKSITLTASDEDGDNLTYAVITSPVNGTLTGSAPNLTYTPDNGFTGNDSFIFMANDGIEDSNLATISISIAGNNAPVADDQAIVVDVDTSNGITLTASDADGDALIFTVLANPVNGTLSGSVPSLVYTPNAGFIGSDLFTFKANDGTEDSNVATVSISVEQLPDGIIWADLVGVSANGNNLIKTAANGWTNGGAASTQVITGNGGVDVIAKKDGKHWMIGLSDSNPDASYSTIDYALYINGNGVLGVYENGTYRGSIGNYVDGDRVQVERTGTIVVYKVNGTALYSSVVSSNGDLMADVSIYSTGGAINDANIIGGGAAPNYPPVAEDQNVAARENMSANITLVATDSNEDALTYSVVTSPVNGALSGTAPDLTYIPDAGFTGNDIFTFMANDGFNDSNIATVTINVIANNSPLANDQSVTVVMDVPENVVLTANDADGDALIYSVVTSPVNGTLNGSAPNLIYTSDTGYVGNDSFTFMANDGNDDSNIATVSITVELPPSGVIWTDMVNVSVKDGTLTKKGVNGWTNGGAASTQVIAADGGVNALAFKDGKHWMMGLSDSNMDASYSTIDYALYVNGNGVLGVYENGAYRGSIGSYADGDRVQVERVGTVIHYKINGVTLFTSSIGSNGNLVVDVSIYSNGGEIVDAKLI